MCRYFSISIKFDSEKKSDYFFTGVYTTKQATSAQKSTQL